jgi:hypothetical protein
MRSAISTGHESDLKFKLSFHNKGVTTQILKVSLSESEIDNNKFEFEIRTIPKISIFEKADQ